MKPGRPKQITQAQRERLAEPSCEKCRHLTTERVPKCAMGRKLVLCADFKDASKATPRLEGGITRLYHYPT